MIFMYINDLKSNPSVCLFVCFRILYTETVLIFWGMYM